MDEKTENLTDIVAREGSRAIISYNIHYYYNLVISLVGLGTKVSMI